MVRPGISIFHALVAAAIISLGLLDSAAAQKNTDTATLREFSGHFGVFEPHGSTISTTTEIAGVRDYFEHDVQAVFQDARIGMDEYRFQVPNGTYSVALYFAEIEKSSIGERIFGITLQDQPVVDRLDIFAEVGANHAYQIVSQSVNVTDGELRLGFQPVIGEALLSAISIEGAIAGKARLIDRSFYSHMNCGGPQFEGFNPDFGA